MKTTISIFLISAGLFFAACTMSHTITTEVIVLNDVTDKFLSRPVPSDILSLYGLGKNQFNGGIFRFSDLTDVSMNQTQEEKIGSVNQWLSNQFQRQNQVDSFNSGVTAIITQANHVSDGENNSSIYLPLATALNQLCQSNADKKYLLVYSDLMENTPQVTFYSEAMLQEIEQKPKSVQALFTAEQQLPSLKGITIYLLYEPTDPLQDEEYRIVSKFYQDLLVGKGATVIISPNLQS